MLCSAMTYVVICYGSKREVIRAATILWDELMTANTAVLW